MRVRLRVARASVWLSSVALARQDGVLALVRTKEDSSSSSSSSPRIASGAVEKEEKADDAREAPRKKRWAVTPVQYDHAAQARQPVELEILESRKGDSDGDGTVVEIVLFELSTAASRRGQRVTWLASASLRLSASDLAAVDGAREVVFRAPLDGGWGTVEVAVQRAGDETAMTATACPASSDEGAFSVQWASSEALERDLAAKERARADAEAALLTRLMVAEASAQRSRALRDDALTLVRRKRAAISIQRAFHAWRSRRRAWRRQLRREREEQEQRRKQALRDKVVERNQRRTQRLIDQWTTTPPPKTTTSREPEHSSAGPELAAWVETQREATATKLAATLARLEREREEKLRASASGDSGDDCVVGVRWKETEEDDEEDDGNESPPAFLSDGLVHAVRRLHLRK